MTSSDGSVKQEDPERADYLAEARKILADNPILFDKIGVSCVLAHHRVPEILADVLRFLALVKWSSRRLTPSERVDKAWHEFILCTRSYGTFCERRFGRFIHHHPGGDEGDNRSQFRDTLKLYSLHFGPPNSEFWGVDSSGPSADCGACEA